MVYKDIDGPNNCGNNTWSLRAVLKLSTHGSYKPRGSMHCICNCKGVAWEDNSKESRCK